MNHKIKANGKNFLIVQATLDLYKIIKRNYLNKES